jgi:stage V sporulation protein R
MKQLLENRARWLEDKAAEMGLDFFPINWEVVPEEVMLEVMSYGLPTRARHWSYGQSYDYQKMNGEMGLSKVYELVLNNDPAYAFLLDTNADVANTMVIAHVIGHVHFFKNNYLFKQTDRKMVYHAAERARKIDDYIQKYGLEKVEHTMDMALAFEKNIDWQKGVYRKPYPKRKKVRRKIKVNEFADLFGKNNNDYKEVVVNNNFPPVREYDLLWFFSNYGRLESWQQDVFRIVRNESFYFYPQYYTKIMNEGFASYIHAELMYLADEENLEDHEHLEFCKIHERVVQPGGSILNINPYFLGFTIFNDIKKRWDKKFEDGESDINGFQKILQVVEGEDDISFIRTYLTKEIAKELKLFSYKTYYNKSQDKIVEIMSTDLNDIIEDLTQKIYHYRVPLIYISKASLDGLEMVHDSKEIGTMDPKHAERWMEYIYEIWGNVVDLKTVDNDGDVLHFTFDELGFSHHGDNFDTPPKPKNKRLP